MSITGQHPFLDHPIAQLARERIVVLDGAMGTEIQALGLSDDAFRGDRFCDHGCDLGGVRFRRARHWASHLSRGQVQGWHPHWTR